MNDLACETMRRARLLLGGASQIAIGFGSSAAQRAGGAISSLFKMKERISWPLATPRAVKLGAKPQGDNVIILYDAENMSAGFFQDVWDCAAGEGTILAVRVYGPEAVVSTAAWNAVWMSHGIERIVSQGCRAGKNSSDITLAIDAVDLLAAVDAKTYVIVSNDTDFAPLAWRLRKGGKRVVGIGSDERNEAYREAFDRFVSLNPAPERTPSTAIVAASRIADSLASVMVPARPDPEFMRQRSQQVGIDEGALYLAWLCARKGQKADGWCYLARFSQLVQEHAPSFSPKHYRCKNMLAFVRKTGMFDVKCVENIHRIRLRPCTLD